MNTKGEEGKYIPGIFNYCDRWCERCPFSKQCQNFQIQSDIDFNDENYNLNAFAALVQRNLKDAVDMLEKIAKETGVDWQEVKKGAESHAYIPPPFTTAQKTIQSLSKQYYKKAQFWLESNEDLIKEKEIEINRKRKIGINVEKEVDKLNEAFSNIYYYLEFIDPKIRRAIEGLHDKWTMSLSPIQNDATGTAKIAIIAIEKSMASWNYLRNQVPDTDDDALDILVNLSRMLEDMKKEFPKVDEFVRPGFDEMGDAVSDSF